MLKIRRRLLVAGSVKRLALSGVLLSGATALVGHGAFSTFTSSATGGPQTITTGTVVIALGATGASTNRLTVNATDVAPGDTIQRSVDLSNTGSLNLASITLGMSAAPSSTLDTDATNGLQVTVQSCPVAWAESASTPYTYTCSGTQATVLASTPVATLETTPSSLPSLNSLAPSGVDHLVATLALPTSAPNAFQGLTSTLTYTFTGTQRNGQSD